jgi:hypothetical protein
MMKLAYRVCIVSLILLTFVFAVSAQDKDARSAKDDRNTAPTLAGPTGLFTVYDGDTLRKGEFTFSGAYSNRDRDPGNADIVEIPLAFQYGLTNRIEVFVNTEAYRAIKINSPRNLSGFAMPNSRILIGGLVTSAPAIILAPSGPGTGAYEGRAIYRPTGTQPFVQFPFIGGNPGNFGLTFPFTPGPLFGYPVGPAQIGAPVAGGSGAAAFPGMGSVYGSILPGVVLQTACSGTIAASCVSPAATVPTVFTLAPSYLPDAPFINRTYGESAFNYIQGGVKWRFTGIRNPIGAGLVVSYKWYLDNADDFTGFNQLQRGSSPGGNMGDVDVTLFAGARLATWANLSANVGYTWTSKVKAEFPSGNFTILDRGDELNAGIGLDFPVNKYFQPIFELTSKKYVGGRTPNAFENDPIDAIAGFRIFPKRWFGFGFAYRYHANEQDEDSFGDDGPFNTAILVTCPPQTTACTPRTITTTWTGVPPGFQTSSDPHGYIVQAFFGRRDKRQDEVINQFANVNSVTLSDTTITLGCQPGFRPREGTTCNDSSSISVATSATDPENDVLTYNYTVSGGRIVGTGANVSWDVSGLAPGTYTITAGVDDGCGLCGKTQTQTITIAECDCVRVCECPSLSVTGPAGVTNPGDSMTFTANVSGGSQQSVTYNWTVSAGTITSGQGTPSITVATDRAMAGGNVTATVDIGGTDPSCSCTTTASETAPVAPAPSSELVDEFGKLPNDDIRSRLDAFFQVLSNNPDNQGYIINYGTDREITARERLITNHINFRNFDRSRITLVRGGASPDGEPRTKLYRIPPGAENPAP